MLIDCNNLFFKVFASFAVDDISAFLPPGFKPPTEEKKPATTTTEKATTTTAAASKDEFKLDLSKLFSDIKTDASLLPPGFNPDQPEPPKAETTTKKITLKFPTRPGSSSSSSDSNSAKKAGERPKPPVIKPASGPPPFVPKIKSFAER